MADGSIPADAPVLVIGLGRFGSSTANQLVKNGREVLAVDTDIALVQESAEQLTHVVQADARSLESLRQVGATNFAVAVVAVGTSIESSVLITANLVDLGVRRIWAKAISPTHGKILERIGAHRVVYPETEAGHRTAHLLSGRMMDFIEFDAGFVLAKMHAPRSIDGRRVADTGLKQRRGITVVGLKEPGGPFRSAQPDDVVHSEDTIVCAGTAAAIEAFAESD